MESRDPDFSHPISYNNSFVSQQVKGSIEKNFSGLTGFGIILELKEYLEEIIADFRLSAFKKSH